MAWAVIITIGPHAMCFYRMSLMSRQVQNHRVHETWVSGHHSHEINNVMYTSPLSPFVVFLTRIKTFSWTLFLNNMNRSKFMRFGMCNHKLRKGRYTLYLKFKKRDLPNTHISAEIYRTCIPDLKSPLYTVYPKTLADPEWFPTLTK